MNKSNNNMLLIGFSILLSMTALITVVAHWPDRGRTVTMMVPARQVAAAKPAANLNVVMHDPGCHWFQTDAGLKTVAKVSGPVNLHNMDEAALRIVGPSGSVVDHVGQSVRLAPGNYKITMVGQASDDNHLKLTVS